MNHDFQPLSDEEVIKIEKKAAVQERLIRRLKMTVKGLEQRLPRRVITEVENEVAVGMEEYDGLDWYEKMERDGIL